MLGTNLYGLWSLWSFVLFKTNPQSNLFLSGKIPTVNVSLVCHSKNCEKSPVTIFTLLCALLWLDKLCWFCVAKWYSAAAMLTQDTIYGTDPALLKSIKYQWATPFENISYFNVQSSPLIYQWVSKHATSLLSYHPSKSLENLCENVIFMLFLSALLSIHCLWFPQ